MTFWDRVVAVFKREKADLDEVVGDITRDANAELDRAERELHATPEEKIAIEQEKGAAIDAEYEALKRQIEGS